MRLDFADGTLACDQRDHGWNGAEPGGATRAALGGRKPAVEDGGDASDVVGSNPGSGGLYLRTRAADAPVIERSIRRAEVDAPMRRRIETSSEMRRAASNAMCRQRPRRLKRQIQVSTASGPSFVKSEG